MNSIYNKIKNIKTSICFKDSVNMGLFRCKVRTNISLSFSILLALF